MIGRSERPPDAVAYIERTRELYASQAPYRWVVHDPEREPPPWCPIDGSLAQISVGSASHIWGVNAQGNVFRYRGEDQWQRTDGSLKHVSAAYDGSVFGVNADDQVFQYME